MNASQTTQGVAQHVMKTMNNNVNNQQQFQSYQIKKMYNTGEAMNFGSAEIKLKQLQLKLGEAEQKIAQLSSENKMLMIQLKEWQDCVPDEIADRIETALIETSKDVLNNFAEHEKLRSKLGESQINMLNEKERSKNNILKIFKEIGRERAYHTMTAIIAAPRRGSIRNLDTSNLK